MALEKFDLGTLLVIDEGRIKEAFEQALRRGEVDCRDRPLLSQTRTITLEASLTPVADEQGALVECLVQFTIKDKQPIRSSKVYHMSAGRAGLFWNELSPDDARQLTLDTVEGPQPIEGRKDVHAG
jgi:hypothetical protein